VRENTNIYLIGPMGSGKTAVGRQLAKEFGLEFFDNDAEIESSTGVDISFIFEKEGEASFRQRERDCIRKLTHRENIVLATGGGSVMDEDIRHYLAQSGTVIYLKTSVERQLERTKHARHRPLLMDGEPEETLERLSIIRSPLYEGLASVTVDTGGRHVRAVVSNIRKILKDRGLEPLKN
jgi:shikimate kinase